MRQLADNIWVFDQDLAAGPLNTFNLGARMTVVRLADGLFVHSPIKLTPEVAKELDALGPVAAVVAPNRLHHLFVGDYFGAYPKARIYAAPGLAEKRPDLKFHGALGNQAESAWARQLEQHFVSGAPLMNEVVFFHPPSRTLLLADLAFNMKRTKTTFDAIVLRMLGDFGELGVGYPGRLMFMMRRRDNRESIDRILKWDFDRVVMSHGDVVESGGREALRKAFSFL